MPAVAQAVINYFREGTLESHNNETNQKIIIVNLFSFVGMTLTGVLAISSTFSGHFLVATSLYISSAIYFFARINLTRFSRVDSSASIILYSLYLLIFYLVYSGGVESTGPLWIFLVAPVSLFLKGLKQGLISIAVFLLVVCTILFYPSDVLLQADYTHIFKTRLIYSFLTITFLSACYEFSRQQSYQYVKDLSRKYEELSKFDPLTGVSNRRSATSKLEREQRRVLQKEAPLSIILCDVDHFKAVNDEFGHEAGDQVLVELATLLSSSLRKQDLVARWGGEEFLLILPGTDGKAARHIAEKIHRRLAESTMTLAGKDVNVTISMGYAEVGIDEDIKAAIAVADKYLYQAKSAGRNRTCGQEE
jgi:diguanylate cyclase (GGDEF)-like protein